MFWEKFIELCNIHNKTPNAVCAELGLSNSTATKWKSGASPRSTTLKQVADYFGVSTSFFYNKEKAPVTGSARDESPFGTKMISVTDDEEKVIDGYRKHPELHTAIRRMLEIEETDKKEKAAHLPVRVAARSGKDYNIDGEEDTEIKVL